MPPIANEALVPVRFSKDGLVHDAAAAWISLARGDVVIFPDAAVSANLTFALFRGVMSIIKSASASVPGVCPVGGRGSVGEEVGDDVHRFNRTDDGVMGADVGCCVVRTGTFRDDGAVCNASETTERGSLHVSAGLDDDGAPAHIPSRSAVTAANKRSEFAVSVYSARRSCSGLSAAVDRGLALGFAGNVDGVIVCGEEL